MERHNRTLYAVGSLVVLAVLFVALALLADLLLRGARVDLTENRMYTLSDGTREVLENLEEPVTLYLFFSEQASRELPQIRAHAEWVEEMLEEFSDIAGDRLSVERVDPAPFSPEEDEAARFGLQAVPVGAGGDTLYFGIAGTNSLDDVQVMPFVQPAKQAFLEYDLAKMVQTLSQPERRRVGLLSSLPMGAGFDPATQGMREAWVIHQQLAQLFEVVDIAPGADALPEDIELLVVVHPKALAEPMQYAIDQFVLGGGRLLAFMDPLAEVDRPQDPNSPMAQLGAGASSTLGPLLDAWGVGFDTGRVVGDLLYALQVSRGAGLPPVRHPAILSIGPQHMSDEDIVTADLEVVNVSSAGWLEPVEGAATEFQALVTSSENAMPLDAAQLRFVSDPAQLLQGFEATGDTFAIAARLTGPARSAFEAPPEGVDARAHRESAGEDGINVVLAADVDLLSDRMWVQKQNFLGQTLVTAFADNGNLAVNAVDNLLGSSALIRIRTRADLQRPFDRVEQLRVAAEARYRDTEQQLQRELEDTERKLGELQGAREDDNFTVLSDAQQAELERFMDQRAQIRQDLRQVRHDLERDIDALGDRLKFINIVLVPALVALLGLALGWRRRRQREAHA